MIIIRHAPAAITKVIRDLRPSCYQRSSLVLENLSSAQPSNYRFLLNFFIASYARNFPRMKTVIRQLGNRSNVAI